MSFLNRQKYIISRRHNNLLFRNRLKGRFINHRQWNILFNHLHNRQHIFLHHKNTISQHRL
jgi:hypothetical protein